MHESAFLEKIAKRARLEATRTSVLNVLTARFTSEAAEEFKEALDGITDEAKLSERSDLRLRLAGLAPSAAPYSSPPDIEQ